MKNKADSSKTTALLVIDVQKGQFSKSTPVYKAEEVLRNITTLVEQAHRVGVPVFYVRHSAKNYLVKGSDDWQFHPSLQPLNKDILIEKTHPSSFEETNLASELEAKHIHSLLVTGLVTHGCVKAACLDAQKRGYQVTLVEDGHSNYNQKAAEYIREWNQKLQADGVTVKPTRSLLKNMQGINTKVVEA
jgi:nicotinamidase-related amidase